MQRVAWAVATWMMLASAAHAAPCVTVEKAYAAQDVAKQAAEARYAKALVARKLKPVALEQIRLRAHEIGDTVRGDFKVDTAEEAEDSGVKIRVVTGLGGGGCGRTTSELVQQGSKIFRVERKPKPGTATTLEVCTCPGTRGGCGVRPVSWAIGYVLPAGVTFGGILPVEYVEDSVALTHAGTCAPPPPPP